MKNPLFAVFKLNKYFKKINLQQKKSQIWQTKEQQQWFRNEKRQTIDNYIFFKYYLPKHAS